MISQMKKFYILFFFIAIVFTSCEESANIRVQNLVHNASLENINYGDYPVTYSLYPGETSSKADIRDKKDSWPKISQLEFFMVRDGNRVYLKTKFGYQLEIDQDLKIVIADTTEVVSPFEKKSRALGDFE
jgi:hypothetical protein